MVDSQKDLSVDNNNNSEEDGIVVAQRFLNIFRQLHIFTPERKKSFNEMILEQSPEVRGMFGRLIGGTLLQEYVDDLENKAGTLGQRENDNIKSNKDFADKNAASGLTKSINAAENTALDNKAQLLQLQLQAQLLEAVKNIPAQSSAPIDNVRIEELVKNIIKAQSEMINDNTRAQTEQLSKLITMSLKESYNYSTQSIVEAINAMSDNSLKAMSENFKLYSKNPTPIILSNYNVNNPAGGTSEQMLENKPQEIVYEKAPKEFYYETPEAKPVAEEIVESKFQEKTTNFTEVDSKKTEALKNEYIKEEKKEDINVEAAPENFEKKKKKKNKNKNRDRDRENNESLPRENLDTSVKNTEKNINVLDFSLFEDNNKVDKVPFEKKTEEYTKEPKFESVKENDTKEENIDSLINDFDDDIFLDDFDFSDKLDEESKTNNIENKNENHAASKQEGILLASKEPSPFDKHEEKTKDVLNTPNEVEAETKEKKKLFGINLSRDKKDSTEKTSKAEELINKINIFGNKDKAISEDKNIKEKLLETKEPKLKEKWEWVEETNESTNPSISTANPASTEEEEWEWVEEEDSSTTPTAPIASVATEDEEWEWVEEEEESSSTTPVTPATSVAAEEEWEWVEEEEASEDGEWEWEYEEIPYEENKTLVDKEPITFEESYVEPEGEDDKKPTPISSDGILEKESIFKFNPEEYANIVSETKNHKDDIKEPEFTESFSNFEENNVENLNIESELSTFLNPEIEEVNVEHIEPQNISEPEFEISSFVEPEVNEEVNEEVNVEYINHEYATKPQIEDEDFMPAMSFDSDIFFNPDENEDVDVYNLKKEQKTEEPEINNLIVGKREDSELEDYWNLETPESEKLLAMEYSYDNSKLDKNANDLIEDLEIIGNDSANMYEKEKNETVYANAE